MSERGLLPIIKVHPDRTRPRDEQAIIRRIFFPRHADASEVRAQAGTRELLQLFARTLGEQQQTMTPAELPRVAATPGSNSQWRSTRLLANTFDLRAQIFMMIARRKLGRHLMQRHHVGAATIAVSFDQLGFRRAARRFESRARQSEARVADSGANESKPRENGYWNPRECRRRRRTRFKVSDFQDAAAYEDNTIDKISGARRSGSIGYSRALVNCAGEHDDRPSKDCARRKPRFRKRARRFSAVKDLGRSAVTAAPPASSAARDQRTARRR